MHELNELVRIEGKNLDFPFNAIALSNFTPMMMMQQTIEFMKAIESVLDVDLYLGAPLHQMVENLKPLH